MASPYHINPRIRAYGKARIDITRRARTEEEWQELWREPLNSLPFRFDDSWKFCFEYTVADYAAEVGFYIDILGFPVRAFSPVFAQFSLPGDEFGFNVIAAQEGQEDTNPNTIRMQIAVKNIDQAAQALENRGIAFQRPPAPLVVGGSIFSGYFRSPHGVCIELIGELSTQSHVDAPTGLSDSAARQSPALEDLLELPAAEDQEDENQEEEYPEVEERIDDQELGLEPEYVDEIPDDELESASGDARSAKLSIGENRQNSRMVPAEKPGSGYAPGSVPLSTLRLSQNLPRDGSTRWPASNHKPNGRSVFDEAEVDEL